VTTHRVPPLAELIGQSLMLALQGEGLQILEPLVHQVEGAVDQLGGLVGGHGNSESAALLSSRIQPGCSDGHPTPRCRQIRTNAIHSQRRFNGIVDDQPH